MAACCSSLTTLSTTQNMASSLTTLIDLSKPSLIACVASIAFNPTAWNIVARNGVSLTRPSLFLFELTLTAAPSRA